MVYFSYLLVMLGVTAREKEVTSLRLKGRQLVDVVWSYDFYVGLILVIVAPTKQNKMCRTINYQACNEGVVKESWGVIRGR